ncbi:hypothetical protein CANINC_000111 [Pichia inconspicua]|uniref:Protein BFR2 n=1 Tax=Pichia inconspicua TaxID=52247 RepID=A0A4V4NGA8_9ASCO|nr:hypothetical protein CANINC_000111 [[Candida] inconspicua]
MAVKASNKKTLGEKIAAKLNRSKTKDFDIEDESFQVSTKVNETDDSDGDEDKELEELSKREHYVKVSKSKIRDTTINLGEKYVGAKVERDHIFENVSEDEELLKNDDVTDDNDSNTNENSFSDDSSFSSHADALKSDPNFPSDSENEFDDNSEHHSENDSDDSGSDFQIESKQDFEDEVGMENERDGSDDNESDSFKRDKIAKLLDNEKRQILNRLSTSAKSDAIKGYTVLRQGSEYDKILDARIKIQKAVISSNYLPVDKKSFLEFRTKETDHILNTTEEKLYSLIDRLLQLRSNQLVKDGLLKDQLIDSSSKKRKLSEYLGTNKKINEAVEPITKSVLVKWSNRVQSASGVGALNQGKFKVINQSVWSQVANQLGDVERLIKRTRINRRGIVPLGYDESSNTKDNEEDDDNGDDDNDDESDDNRTRTAGLSNVDKSLQSNTNIFDDDDFYRLLLNDMINKKLDQKQAQSSAVLMLSRNKMQKSYDRMATKGRKLKYTVQEPLQQFEIPRRKYYTWNDEQIDELFAGLFGTNFNVEESDENEEEIVTDEQKVEDLSKLRESTVKLFG